MPGDSLAVVDLRCSNLALDLELAAEAVNNNLQVQLSHALNDGLVGLLITAVAKRGVLLRELVQSHAHLLEISLGLGLNGDLDHRVGEVHLLQDDGALLIAKSLTYTGVQQCGVFEGGGPFSQCHLIGQTNFCVVQKF